MTAAGNGVEGRTIFYGWWVVVAATLVLCSQGVIFYGFGVLFPSILEEFGWSRALTSSVFSVQIGANSIFILLMGYLTDKYSSRLVIGLGAVLLGTGLILSSLTREIWHLYLFFGLIVGAGTSTMYVTPLTVVMRWFDSKKGLALGITVTGIGIGGFVGSPVLNALIQAYGWRTAILVLGVVIGGLVFVAAMMLVGDPKEKGLVPYREEGPSKGAAQGLPHVQASRIQASAGPAGPGWTVREAVKTRAFLILFLMFFFAEVALVGIMGHLFTHATEQGLPRHVVSWAYGVIGVASLVGKVGAGVLSDRIGRRVVFFLAFALKGTAFLFLIPQASASYIFLFAVLLGLSYGGWTPLFPAILSDFFGLSSMGKIFSVLTLNFLFGGVLGPILAGWVFDRLGSYLVAFVIFSGICYVAAVLSCLLKAPDRGLGAALRSS